MLCLWVCYSALLNSLESHCSWNSMRGVHSLIELALLQCLGPALCALFSLRLFAPPIPSCVSYSSSLCRQLLSSPNHHLRRESIASFLISTHSSSFKSFNSLLRNSLPDAFCYEIYVRPDSSIHLTSVRVTSTLTHSLSNFLLLSE